MSLEAELDALARRLTPRGAPTRAVMVTGVSGGAGASTVASGLAQAAVRAGARPVWLFDLDFRSNAHAARAPLGDQVYSGALQGERFWREAPAGSGRLALCRRTDAPIFISRFDRAPGEVRQLTFHRAPRYWDAARRSTALTLVDAPFGGAAVTALAADMDGVILVADARRDDRASAERAAAALEQAGARVLGLVVNRSAPARAA